MVKLHVTNSKLSEKHFSSHQKISNLKIQGDLSSLYASSNAHVHSES